MKKSIIASTIILSTTFTFALDLGSIAKGVAESVINEKQTNTTIPTLNNNNR